MEETRSLPDNSPNGSLNGTKDLNANIKQMRLAENNAQEILLKPWDGRDAMLISHQRNGNEMTMRYPFTLLGWKSQKPG